MIEERRMISINFPTIRITPTRFRSNQNFTSTSKQFSKAITLFIELNLYE